MKREVMPNGWPTPTFMSVDPDGALDIEWCFGSQGADDSFRIMFSWDPSEGAMAIRTAKNEQRCLFQAEGAVAAEIVPTLDGWLRDAVAAPAPKPPTAP